MDARSLAVATLVLALHALVLAAVVRWTALARPDDRPQTLQIALIAGDSADTPETSRSAASDVNELPARAFSPALESPPEPPLPAPEPPPPAPEPPPPAPEPPPPVPEPPPPAPEPSPPAVERRTPEPPRRTAERQKPRESPPRKAERPERPRPPPERNELARAAASRAAGAPDSPGAPASASALASAPATLAAPAAQRTAPRVDASWAGNEPPKYPLRARRMGEQGEVRIDVHVGEDGRVNDVRLRRSSGSDLLDRTAMDTVRRWRFKPATVDGEPVAEWYRDWKWVFRLNG